MRMHIDGQNMEVMVEVGPAGLECRCDPVDFADPMVRRIRDVRAAMIEVRSLPIICDCHRLHFARVNHFDVANARIVVGPAANGAVAPIAAALFHAMDVVYSLDQMPEPDFSASDATWAEYWFLRSRMVEVVQFAQGVSALMGEQPGCTASDAYGSQLADRIRDLAWLVRFGKVNAESATRQLADLHRRAAPMCGDRAA